MLLSGSASSYTDKNLPLLGNCYTSERGAQSVEWGYLSSHTKSLSFFWYVWVDVYIETSVTVVVFFCKSLCR